MLYQNWRDMLTPEERALINRWTMYGSDCLAKVGRRWDSGVPGAPLTRTKKAADEYLTRFVCDTLPLRCRERIESERTRPC